MRIAVTIGIYNEEINIAVLLQSLITQTHTPHEIIIVDDGSTDNTAEIIKEFQKKYTFIKYIYQSNQGPATARNKAWKNANTDICVFTDGDCIPEKNWIENLVKPFYDKSVGATGGTYKTLNNKSILARFIGLEIQWKYKYVEGEIDVHGSYNLSIRKQVLEEIGGFDESYPMPSGEDWDLTYKVSKKYKIIYVSEAIVGHYHPEKFWWYMKNQGRRAYDRVKIYKDHPGERGNDTYTPWYIKYQIVGSGLLVPSIIFVYPFFKYSFLVPVSIFAFLLIICLIPFKYFINKDISVAFYSIFVQLSRNFAWFIGLIKGLFNLGA